MDEIRAHDSGQDELPVFAPGIRLLITLTPQDEALLAERLAARLGRMTTSDSPRSDHQRLLTVSEAAAYLRCSKQRIYDLRWQGRLPAKREGRRLLFARDALDSLLEDG